jgi:hypothetical protein
MSIYKKLKDARKKIKGVKHHKAPMTRKHLVEDKQRTYETHNIVDNKVKTDLMDLSGDLHYAMEEGMSDQQIMFNAMAVQQEIGRLQEKLKGMLGYKDKEEG